jgi:exopolysaccharide biosynthesis polyprenyl glycosylphosphotransferase
MKKFARTITLLYIISDFLFSALAWGLFYLFCRHFIETRLPGEAFLMESGSSLFPGILFIALFFVFVFTIAGFYSDPLRRSRLLECGRSFIVTLAAVVILFFALIIGDAKEYYLTYSKSFLTLFVLEFFLTWTPRFIITSVVSGRIHRREAGFRTLIVGSNGKAVKLINDIKNEKLPAGNLLTGYISTDSVKGSPLAGEVPCLGTKDDIISVMEGNEIEEVILALEENEYNIVEELVNELCYRDVRVKAIPSMRQVIEGHVEAGPIYATPLLRVSHREMPRWQYATKVLLDYAVSLLALIVLSPLMAVLAVLIRCSGKGPVIFRQERIGRYGRPFMIYKFRSMEEDAETDGPQLAVKGDTRITPLGRFMRKHRFDEIPNFINVLKGEMSLVGPRPERSHYIEQIRKKAPYYNRVLAVKPGITCWGLVKLGYASDIDMMLQRLDYDLLYLENVSLFLDMKIIYYTLGTIIMGRGI